MKMNNSEFKNWRKNHSSGMYDLTFAHTDDIFIFTRFTLHTPFKLESKQVLYAENTQEAIFYLRHIFLNDILIDAIDDVELDFKAPFNERQKDVILLLNYLFKLGKLTPENTEIKKLKALCDSFNCDLTNRKNLEYEIQILNGADELRKFLIKKYSSCENFNKKQLSNFCSKDFFVGQKLKEFLDELFNSN